MTREDINDIIKTLCPNDEDFEKPIISPAYLKKELEVLALEQEPILDKIRAEIEQNAYPIVHGVNNHEKGMTLYDILQVIDKYKAESEDKE